MSIYKFAIQNAIEIEKKSIAIQSKHTSTGSKIDVLISEIAIVRLQAVLDNVAEVTRMVSNE